MVLLFLLYGSFYIVCWPKHFLDKFKTLSFLLINLIHSDTVMGGGGVSRHRDIERQTHRPRETHNGSANLTKVELDLLQSTQCECRNKPWNKQDKLSLERLPFHTDRRWEFDLTTYHVQKHFLMLGHTLNTIKQKHAHTHAHTHTHTHTLSYINMHTNVHTHKPTVHSQKIKH